MAGNSIARIVRVYQRYTLETGRTGAATVLKLWPQVPRQMPDLGRSSWESARIRVCTQSGQRQPARRRPDTLCSLTLP